MTESSAGASTRRPRPLHLPCQNPTCERVFPASRRDARTCSARCRQALARHEREQAGK